MDITNAEALLQDFIKYSRDSGNASGGFEDAIELLLSEYKEAKHTIGCLQNRCIALTHGMICVYCPIKCEKRQADYINNSEDKDK